MLALIFGISPYHILVVLGLIVCTELIERKLKIGRGFGQLGAVIVAGGLLNMLVLQPVPGNVWFAPMVAAAALSVAIALALRGWAFRRRVWINAPEQLGQEPPPSSVGVSLGLILVAGATALALNGAGSWASGWAAIFAGLAACVLGHLSRREWAGGFGLWIIGLGVALCTVAWGGGWTLGFVLASGYMLWLAGFWHQQLLEEQPWTTTGSLIPWARAGAVIFGIVTLPTLTAFDPDATWISGLILLIVFVQALLLFKDAVFGEHVWTAAMAWWLAGGCGYALLGPHGVGWLVTEAGGWMTTESGSVMVTPAVALGGFVLSLRRVLFGRHEPVTATANLNWLGFVAILESLGGLWQPLVCAIPVMAFDLLTNRPAPEGLAEAQPVSSNP